MNLRLRLARLICVVFFVQAYTQSNDPINDFCRRFAHQTTIIDRKLYIDGGLVNYDTVDVNYTNTYLLYADLDDTLNNFPVEFDNLTVKSQNVPSVQGGILWPDTVNKIFYLYGGEFYDTTPQPFALWAYDTIYDTWNETSTDATDIVRASFGAGTFVDDRAWGYYYGGWLSNSSIPTWSGDAMAVSSLLIYDMLTNQWTNGTGPDDGIPRAEGVMIYIPASDAGMLVYFGGVSTPYGNSTMVGENMADIYLYDIASTNWYTQKATGQIPEMRRRFCAGASRAEDQSSYNIYIYGGLAIPEGNGFDDVYILSLPSFTWIRWWTDNGTTHPHHSMTCNVIDGSQMIVMGGTFPNSTACDVKQVWGMHNLNLGERDPATTQWYQFLPNVTSYEVPAAITATIGGGATGGATLTKPTDGFDAADLSVYFGRKYTATTRTATRYIPPTNTTTPIHKSDTNVGAIAGGAVGGAVFLVACFVIACLCLRRRRKRRATSTTSQTPGEPYIAPTNIQTAELESSYAHSHPGSHPTSPFSAYDQQKPPPGYPFTATPTSPPLELHGQNMSQQQHRLYMPELSGQQYFPPPQGEARAYSHTPPPPQLEMPTIRSPVNAHEAQQMRPGDMHQR